MPKKSVKKKAKPAKAEIVKLPQMPSEQELVITKMREFLPKSVDERWLVAEHNYAVAGTAMVKAGAALLTIQADLKHGEFLNELEGRGISRSTAYRLMGAARKFPTVGSLAKLGPSKIYALTEGGLSENDYDPETDTIDGQPIDEIEKLSVRELKTKLRKAHTLSKSQDKDIRKAEDTIAGLRKSLNPIPDDYTAALKVCRIVRYDGAAAVGAIHRIDFDKTTDDRIKREAFLAVQSVAMEAVTFITKCFRDENFMHLEMYKGAPMQLIAWLKKYKDDLDEYSNADGE